MASKDTSSNVSWNPTQYWQSRGFRTSARLHLMHWLWKSQLKYTVHPSIPKDAPGLRIADVATGNAAWLVEAAREGTLPADARLDGFDITPTNFPAKAWLPPNVTLHVQDAFAPVPEQFAGKYDVVHVRAISSAIKNNAVEPLLANLIAMLKPGGFLQWEESNPMAVNAQSPSPDVPCQASTQLTSLFKFLMAHTGVKADWLLDMPKTYEAHGLDVVAHTVQDQAKELRKGWTENLLLVYDELVWTLPEEPVRISAGDNSAKGATAAAAGAQGLTRASYSKLFNEVVDETSKGVSLSMDVRVTVGRKRG